MQRRSATSVTIDTNVRSLRIYPTEDTTKTVKELQSVGFRLSREQAIHLARVLIAVTQEWDQVEITGYRFKRRNSDNTYPITVTSSRPGAGN
jgi:hypothetical protein